MKRRTIITSVLVIVLCLGLISGSTFALFTSESSVNIAVTSGKVKLTAELDDEPTLYSADATLTSGTLVDKVDPSDTTGTILPTDAQGTFAGTYYYKDQTTFGKFLNGGTATIGTDGTMTIAKMTPGDKVVAKLLVKNESNVAIKYRLKIVATATDSTKVGSDKILDVLKVRFEGKLYNGLKEFSSAWIAKDAITTAKTYESAVEIIFPLDVADEKYQDNSVNLAFTVEAVQGNAKTVDIVTAATTAIVTGATTKLVVPTSPLAENNTNTEVVLTNVGTTNQTVKLTVETVEYDTTNSPTTYNVLTNEQAAVASVDLKLLVNDEVVTAFESGASAKITTYVIKGLDNIKVVYNGTGDVAFGKNSTTHRVTTSEDDVHEVGEYYYNSTTGKLVFITNHFSEYVPATTDDLVAINTTTNTVYRSLADAIDSAHADDEILLLKDVDTLTRLTITEKTLTLDGNGHSLTASSENIENGRTLNVFGDDSNVTLKNLTINGPTSGSYTRGLNIGDKDTTLNIENCNISCNNYAINIISDTDNLTLNVENSTISGWSAINHHGSSGNITVNGSTLVGINNNSGPTNAFATIVIDGNALFIPNSTVQNNSVTITDSLIVAKQNGDQKQYWITFQYGANDNQANVSIDDKTLILDDFNGKDKRTEINNAGFNNIIKLFLSNEQKETLRNNGYIVVDNENGSSTISVDDSEFVWYSNGSFTTDKSSANSMYTVFKTPFVEKWMFDGEGIMLVKNITLKDDVVCELESGKFYFYFDEYSVSGGKLILNDSIEVVTDTSGMSSVFGGGTIEEIDNQNGTYTYRIQVEAI